MEKLFIGKQKESGFTLIELVMVIVILGILASVAIPKFLDLQGSANQATINGMAGEITSAAKANAAVCAAAGLHYGDAASKIPAAGQPGSTCVIPVDCNTATVTSLLGGALPNISGAAIKVVAGTGITATAAGTCTVTTNDAKYTSNQISMMPF
jgi:MSHA pilin protein MshA